MQKEFVPYEESLDLKELGFDELCFRFYSTEEAWRLDLMPKSFHDGQSLNSKSDVYTLSAPLYQQAFRFFRENHNLLGYICQATVSKGKVYMFSCNKGNDCIFEDIDSDFKTYEKAELVCLRKLIEIVKSTI